MGELSWGGGMQSKYHAIMYCLLVVLGRPASIWKQIRAGGVRDPHFGTYGWPGAKVPEHEGCGLIRCDFSISSIEGSFGKVGGSSPSRSINRLCCLDEKGTGVPPAKGVPGTRVRLPQLPVLEELGRAE